jgi:putative Mn2+ efflux pump MntP
MSFAGLLLIALSLASDCFAAAIGKGTALRRPSMRDALVIGLLFGFFAAVMLVLGWAVGVSARQLVTEFDHWIALGLLSAIGGHMIWEALHSDPAEAGGTVERRIIGWALVGTAFATSIDAAAVGVTFAFLDIDIVRAALVIGSVSCLLSTGGVFLARVTGPLFGRKAEILGGVVLIAIGIKIAVEHTLEQGFLF